MCKCQSCQSRKGRKVYIVLGWPLSVYKVLSLDQFSTKKRLMTKVHVEKFCNIKVKVTERTW